MDSSINTWMLDKLKTIQVLHIIMSLMMLTVESIFFPTSLDGAAGIESMSSSKLTFERFFSNGMNYI